MILQDVISRKTIMWIIPDFLKSTMDKLLAVNEAPFLDIILSGISVRIHWALAGIFTQVSVITPPKFECTYYILAIQSVSRTSRLKCEAKVKQSHYRPGQALRVPGG